MIYLLRGISGSGKSTLANEIQNKSPLNTKHFEADMFFYDVNGDYQFDASKLKEAHQWCFDSFKTALDECYDVIVSNTSTKRWELQKYIDHSEFLNHPYKIIRCMGNFQNTHNVPMFVVSLMKERFEDIEGEELYYPKVVV
jgi:adenylate kinase family enzyme